VQILLTNDDGIHAPGLAALERELSQMGEVTLVAPATEQSGVGHSITYLNPLICKEVYDGDRRRGWAVEGSPADCVKIGMFEFCEKRPDLVVSGINGGLNAGINVLYSGTVAAAIEGAFFGITSVAVSLEYDEQADFGKAAVIARKIIQQIQAEKDPSAQLFNLNIPTVAVDPVGEVQVVPMGVMRYGQHFLRRQDPMGRTYYWATTDPPPPTDTPSDLAALEQGYITLTPMDYDMTKVSALRTMQQWQFRFSG
jgi:5'-nucleotidase